MWRNQHWSQCQGPGGAACPGPGWLLGLMLVQAVRGRRQGDRGCGRPRQVGALGAQGDGESHQEGGAWPEGPLSVPRSALHSASWVEPRWGRHTEKPRLGMSALCQGERQLIR